MGSVSPADGKVEVYLRRWFMLLLFCCFSGGNAFNWIHFSVIPDQLTDYFHISNSMMIDMMSLLFMIAYIPFIFPAIWLIENKGLKISLLVGSFTMAVGGWIKALAFCPNCYPATLVGQTLAAISQVFVLGVPAPMAAAWFPEDEVATATALGVFGNNVGIALGFVLPPIIVPYEDVNEMEPRLHLLLYLVAAVSTFIFVLILIFFQAAPPHPPSEAQLCLQGEGSYDYKKSMLNLLKDRSYMLLVVSYGINAGVFYTISTLLGQTLPSDVCYGEESRDDAGVIGLLIVVAGMVGAVVCGFILDRTKRFKIISLVVYVMAFCGLIVYTFTMCKGGIWVPYVTSTFLGFFMTGYLPIGFEFAAEITYPEPESTTSGLLNAFAQLIGIVFTLSAAKLKDKTILGANIYLCAFLFVGVILTVFIKEDQKRQRILENRESAEKKQGDVIDHFVIVQEVKASNDPSGGSSEKEETGSSRRSSRTEERETSSGTYIVRNRKDTSGSKSS